MILKIIMALGAAFGLFWTIKTRKLFPAVITLGMIIGIILSFFSSDSIQIPGFYVYMGFVALAFIYGLTIKGMNITGRIMICLLSASIFTYWLWTLNHWHGNTLFFALFALLIGVFAIFSKQKFKNEFGFMIILIVDAIAIIIEIWLKSL